MSAIPTEQTRPPEADARDFVEGETQRPQLLIAVQERILQDPILAGHFAGLPTPGVPLLIGDPFNALSSPHQLRTSHRLVRAVDAFGNKYLNQYIVIKLLGCGRYGKVKLCLNAFDGKLFAVKVVDRKRLRDRRFLNEDGDSIMLQEYVHEIATLKKLHHPNIVALHEVIDDVQQRKVYLVLEYVEGGPVMEDNRWIAFPEELAQKYFRDICCGLDYLHYHKVLHRDLKPENLLQTADGRIKISDFGVSQTDALSSTAGTPAFLAPEACTKSSFEGRPVDVWALGVCLYVFVFGTLPFSGKTIPDIYHAIQHKQLSFHPSIVISKELKDLLKLILVKDPKIRISLPSIMEHPWLTLFGLQLLIPLSKSVHGAATMDFSKNDLKSAHTTSTSGLNPLSKVGEQEKRFQAGEYAKGQGKQGNKSCFMNCSKCEILVDADPELGGEMDECVVIKREPGKFGAWKMAAVINQNLTDSPPCSGTSLRSRVPIRGKAPTTATVPNELKDVLDAMPQPQDEKVLSIKKKSSEVRCGQFRWCTTM
ncbi:serine/threonine-protein kinase GRIK1 isoform X6 [Physcomitrium patens]|uniref:serine/threonine-protein kinase GRIK1 isoform X6 n=1 Tax=Physcomitrium patens TaxID=3218 RepID=UPI000D156003|nr:serine/threonine-protein kinase GRIK1-like isoform X6 [Physcomitrium patens]|eukprot:XP_024388158.1 serine/threonine-protein kinase GRIK1-like isoform X6 [Physcomitrella patens]